MTTPLMVNEPLVTAVANPAFPGSENADPRFTPPTGPALVTEYVVPALLTWATSSLSTVSRLPRSAGEPSEIGMPLLVIETSPSVPTDIVNPASTATTAV